MITEDNFLTGLNMAATGKRISHLLDVRGLTDRRLSEMLGLSVQSINKWRHGYNLPDIENLYRLSRILGVKVDDLLVPQELQQEYIPLRKGQIRRYLWEYYLRLSRRRCMERYSVC